MFRPLFQDHLQGLSLALSAPTSLLMHASSYVCIGMWLYALCLYLYPVYLPECCFVVSRQNSTEAGKGDTNTEGIKPHTSTDI
jgi:hypothetical protein